MDVQLWTGQGLMMDQKEINLVSKSPIRRCANNGFGPIPLKKDYHNYSYLNSKSLVKKMGYVEMEITSFNNDGPLLEINVIYFDLMGYVWFMQIPGPSSGKILITILFWNN
jgi:hypothetical protein